MINNLNPLILRYLLLAFGILLAILFVRKIILRLKQAAGMRAGNLDVIDQKRKSNKRKTK